MRRITTFATTSAILLPTVFGMSLAVAVGSVCSTTTPALDETATCASAGSETVTKPTGATAVRIIAIGGGGAAGIANVPGDVITRGGSGAKVTATFTLAAPDTGAAVTVGRAGGQGPTNPAGYSAVSVGADGA